MNLEVLNKDNAPQDARELLEKAEKNYGFIPNILGVMANSPALLEAYMSLSQIFEKTRFSAAEKQTVLLAVSTENDCGYCKSAHTAIAKMQNVDEAVLNAIASGDRLPDAKLDALFNFTRTMVEKRGHPSDDDLQAFFDAGYSEAQVQDVIVGIGMKTMSNYNNHIADTPVDEQFKA
ncbi:MAG: carboxymuconolactone decarboxylase family protein [Wenzhouxiangellaceae bacterium]|nr:carboxymuconolactone decarboxylase family protein [Wenzhouxiangellaceae bacterium]MBS3747043.1 carboxymuconolactone decarboxylase family protein [Wenzhouxiangellaceae bacterium]MBS3823845.1 carboxymuconolactone decarboxylase family protein [Wenzhouxiangellaceae bacterium]